MAVNIPDGWSITTGNWNTDATSTANPSGLVIGPSTNVVINGPWIPIQTFNPLGLPPPTYAVGMTYALTNFSSVTDLYVFRFRIYDITRTSVLSDFVLLQTNSAYGASATGNFSQQCTPTSSGAWARFELTASTSATGKCTLYNSTVRRVSPYFSGSSSTAQVIAANTQTLVPTPTYNGAEMSWATYGTQSGVLTPSAGNYLMTGWLSLSGTIAAGTLFQLQFTANGTAIGPVFTHYVGSAVTVSDVIQFTWLYRNVNNIIISNPSAATVLSMFLTHNAAGSLTLTSTNGLTVVYQGPV